MADSKIYLGNVLVTEPQKQSDWAQTDNASADYIKNKPAETKVVDSASTDEQYPTAKAVYTAIKNGGGGGGNSPFAPGEGENSAVLDNGFNIAQGDNSVAKGVGSIAQGDGSSAEGGYFMYLDGLVFSGESAVTRYRVIEDPNGAFYNINLGDTVRYIGVLTTVTNVESNWNPDTQENEKYFETEETLSGEIITGGDLSVLKKGSISVGMGSHAEGQETVAIDRSSHSEGYKSVSYGEATHAEGYYTKALGRYSHAEGEAEDAYMTSFIFSNTDDNTSFIIDEDPDDEGFNLANSIFVQRGIFPIVAYGQKITKITWVTFDENFEHVEYFGTEEPLTLDGSLLYRASGLRIFDTFGAYGEATHTEGDWASAIGEFSHAEGNNVFAFGSNSHAEGNGSLAFGDDSHAEGRSKAYGENSHAEQNAFALEGSSHAEGDSFAMGISSHSEGENNNRFIHANASVADQDNNFTLSAPISLEQFPVGSFVMFDDFGNDTFKVISRANENKFTVDGFSVPAELVDIPITIITGGAFGEASHSEGIDTTAKGEASHAEGNSTMAIGDYSHAEGRRAVAFSESSHAEQSSIAIGSYSHAEGGSEVIDFDSEIQFSGPQNSLVYTFDNSAHLTVEELPVGSLVIDTRIVGDNQVVRTITDRPDNYTFTVDATFDENNALSGVYLKALKGATYGILSHTEGLNNNAIGFTSHAEGSDNIAIGLGSHVEGSHNIALNEFEHAQGVYNFSHTCDECDNEEDDPSLKTLYSIGNGSEEGGRKNAVEVMQNGEMYIEGVGGFDGQNTGQANSIQTLFSNGFIRKFLLITQSDYDDLPTKDPYTVYLTVDEEPCECECECECDIA